MRLAVGKPGSSNVDLAEERILLLAQRFTLDTSEALLIPGVNPAKIVVVMGLRLGDAKA